MLLGRHLFSQSTIITNRSRILTVNTHVTTPTICCNKICCNKCLPNRSSFFLIIISITTTTTMIVIMPIKIYHGWGGIACYTWGNLDWDTDSVNWCRRTIWPVKTICVRGYKNFASTGDLVVTPAFTTITKTTTITITVPLLPIRRKISFLIYLEAIDYGYCVILLRMIHHRRRHHHHHHHPLCSVRIKRLISLHTKRY